jgi:hypothetical protein
LTIFIMSIRIRSILSVACILSLATAFWVPPRRTTYSQQPSLQQHLPSTTIVTTSTSTRLWESVAEPTSTPPPPKLDGFDLDTALFCGGLAFDTYTEPAQNSSRWERGVSYIYYICSHVNDDDGKMECLLLVGCHAIMFLCFHF